MNDGTNIQPAAAANVNGDNGALITGVTTALWLFNGSAFDRVRTNAAGVISSTLQQFCQEVAGPGQWSTFNNPAANTLATATKAAGGVGIRHVAQMLGWTLTSNAAAAANVTVLLRDGASGAGTILLALIMAIPAVASSFASITLSGLNIFGTANTAMTVEFLAAGGANTIEAVSMAGYSTS